MWCFQTLKGGAEGSTAPSEAKKGSNSELLPLALQVDERGVGCTTLGVAERGKTAVVSMAANGV